MTTWSTINRGFFSYQNRMLLPEICRAVNAGPRTTGVRPQSAYAFTIGTNPDDDAMLPGNVATPRGRKLMRQTFYELDQAMPVITDPRYVMDSCELKNWKYGISSALRSGFVGKYDDALTWKAALLGCRNGADGFKNEFASAYLQVSGLSASVSGSQGDGFMGCSSTWPGFSGCGSGETVRYSPPTSPSVVGEFSPYAVTTNPAGCCMGWAPNDYPREGVSNIYSGIYYAGSPYSVRSDLIGWFGLQGTEATFTITADWAAFLATWATVEDTEGVTPYITVTIGGEEAFSQSHSTLSGLYGMSVAIDSARALDIRDDYNGFDYSYDIDLPIDGSDHEITLTATLSMIDSSGSESSSPWKTHTEGVNIGRGSFVTYSPAAVYNGAQHVQFSCA